MSPPNGKHPPTNGSGKHRPLYKHDALDRQELRRVALDAMVDEKTVVKYLLIRDGDRTLKMQSTTKARVEMALRALGLERLLIVDARRLAAPKSAAPPSR